MISLQDIITKLNLTVLSESQDFTSIFPQSGYNSDLLSCVMAGAAHGSIWVTVQSHYNIIAVAVLIEASAVLITEGSIPDQATIAKANQEGIILLSSKEASFPIIGQLWELGIKTGQ